MEIFKGGRLGTQSKKIPSENDMMYKKEYWNLSLERREKRQLKLFTFPKKKKKKKKGNKRKADKWRGEESRHTSVF